MAHSLYDDFKLDPGQHRFITLSCGNANDSFTCELKRRKIGEISYEALSYEWGDPTHRECIFVT
jgi:hypothetical protein